MRRGFLFASLLLLLGCAANERNIPPGSVVIADTQGGKGPDVYSVCDDKGNLVYLTKDQNGPVSVIQGGCKKPEPVAATATATSTSTALPQMGPHFLDTPVAQCVVAIPCPNGGCVILKPCPPGIIATPTPPIYTPPVVPSHPIAEPCPVCPVCPEVNPQPSQQSSKAAKPKVAPATKCP